MRSLYESILDSDKTVEKGVIVNSIFNSTKDAMFKLFLSDYEVVEQVNQFKNSSEKCTEIIFRENKGQFKSFTDAIKALKNELNEIPDLELNYKIQYINKIFRNYSPTSKTEVVVFEIFYDDEKILEFIMGDMFVNYNHPSSGLSFTFDISSKYQQFINLFK